MLVESSWLGTGKCVAAPSLQRRGSTLLGAPCSPKRDRMVNGSAAVLLPGGLALPHTCWWMHCIRGFSAMPGGGRSLPKFHAWILRRGSSSSKPWRPWKLRLPSEELFFERALARGVGKQGNQDATSLYSEQLDADFHVMSYCRNDSVGERYIKHALRAGEDRAVYSPVFEIWSAETGWEEDQIALSPLHVQPPSPPGRRRSAAGAPRQMLASGLSGHLHPWLTLL